jgi:hypothetical protein
MFMTPDLAWLRRLSFALLVLMPLLLVPGTALADDEDDEGDEWGGWSDPTNYVLQLNRRDDSRMFAGNLDVNFLRRGGEGVTPENVACASSGGLDACMVSCEYIQAPGCIEGDAPAAKKRSTIAVALQLNVYEGTFKGSGPVNAAIAKNELCTDCTVYANAVQSTFAVNFREVDWEDVGYRLHRIERDLERIERDFERGRLSFEQAKAQVDAVIGRFCGVAVDMGGGCSPEDSLG